MNIITKRLTFDDCITIISNGRVLLLFKRLNFRLREKKIERKIIIYAKKEEKKNKNAMQYLHGVFAKETIYLQKNISTRRD